MGGSIKKSNILPLLAHFLNLPELIFKKKKKKVEEKKPIAGCPKQSFYRASSKPKTGGEEWALTTVER